MPIETHDTWPQWLWSALFSLIGGLLGLIFTLTMFIAGGWRKKISELDEAQKTFASLGQVNRLEILVSELASRKELAAYMLQIRDDIQERDLRTREDRSQMHKDNLDRTKEIRDDISGLRTDIREDFRAVHARIDEVASKK